MKPRARARSSARKIEPGDCRLFSHRKALGRSYQSCGQLSVIGIASRQGCWNANDVSALFLYDCRSTPLRDSRGGSLGVQAHSRSRADARRDAVERHFRIVRSVRSHGKVVRGESKPIRIAGEECGIGYAAAARGAILLAQVKWMDWRTEITMSQGHAR